MNRQIRALLAAVLSTLLLLPSLVLVARAETIDITEGFMTGKQTTTVSADGLTETVVKNLSGIDPKTNKYHKTKSKTITKTSDGTAKVSYDVDRLDETFDKEGGQLLASYSDKTNFKYDVAGGVTADSTITNFNSAAGEAGQTVEEHTTGKFDVDDGDFLDGAVKTTTIREKGKKPVVKKEEKGDGKWVQISAQPPASSLIAIAPNNADTVANEQAYLPSTASSQVVATFVDPSSSGPSGQVTVGFVQADNTTKYFRTHTDSSHHLMLNVLKGAKWLLLFKGFDRNGKPDEGAVQCEITRNAAPFSHVAERGGPIDLPGQNINPTTARAVMDGSTQNIETVAASDNDVKAIVGRGASLGRHRFAINAGTAMPGDVITLMADPLPNSEPGRIETVTVHVEGLPPGDSATMEFAVSGAAELASGGSATVVPVRNDLAQVRIIGKHSGQAIVHFHLSVQLAA